jgi:hypothetical protein
MWTGLAWLRIGSGGELLWIPYWTFEFHRMLGKLSSVLATRDLSSSAQLHGVNLLLFHYYIFNSVFSSLFIFCSCLLFAFFLSLLTTRGRSRVLLKADTEPWRQLCSVTTAPRPLREWASCGTHQDAFALQWTSDEWPPYEAIAYIPRVPVIFSSSHDGRWVRPNLTNSVWIHYSTDS